MDAAETNSTPFVVSRLSPPGRGAVGIIEVRGPGALAALETVFRGSLSDDGQTHYGRFVEPSGKAIDDGLVLPVGSTSEGETVRERSYWLTLHGNPVLLERLLEVLVELGGERSRARIGDALSSARDGPHSREIAQQALDLLPDCRSAGAGAFLLEQAGNDGFAGWIERAVTGGVSAPELRDLIDQAKWGRGLFEPRTVVLAGEPNAGKSTLFNRLLGEDRVVSDPEPGTTRDLIREEILIGDYPLLLVDGAGLRSASDAVEREGVTRMRRAMAQADLVVWLTPAGSDPAPPPTEAIGGAGLPLHIVSKADQILPVSPGDSLAVSALTGVGLDLLELALVGGAVGHPASRGEGEIAKAPRRRPVPFLAHHEDGLRRACERLEAGGDPAPDLRRLARKAPN